MNTSAQDCSPNREAAGFLRPGKLIVFDLFCGLGGWSEAFIVQGYEAIGFDVEAHDYGKGGYPGKLVLADVRSLSGAQLVKDYGVPAVIVASPPCQEFSYMAMPWSRAKAKAAKIKADPAEQVRLTALFNECFRIQREVSEAAGRYVPMVVENVRGAQPWVGKARWNFGSFYLWGDVPALMPIPSRTVLKNGITHRSNGATNWHNHDLEERNRVLQKPTYDCLAARHPKYKSEGDKTAGMNWSDQTKRGQDFTRIAGLQCGVKNRDADGFDYEDRTFGWKAPRTMSKSPARKAASAEIAKIPPALATWIAKCFKPSEP